MNSNDSASMDRRELIQLASTALMALAAEGTALPQQLTTTVGADPKWKPVFFNKQQNDTMVVLTEWIVPRTDTPGANDAKVHRYVDLFLSISTPADQRKMVEGLAWLDEYTQQKYKKPFVKCRKEAQLATLTFLAGDAGAPEPGRTLFERTKRLTSMIYFATAEGMKELNRFGTPGTFGCQHSGGHGAGA